MARFPRAYVNDVPNTNNHPGIVRINQDMMDIGARRVSLPKSTNGLEGIDHVGKSAGNK